MTGIGYKTQVSPSQLILAAFCYVTAMMIWKIGEVLIYYGYTPLWFVVMIITCIVVSGFSFQFEGVIFRRKPS